MSQRVLYFTTHYVPLTTDYPTRTFAENTSLTSLEAIRVRGLDIFPQLIAEANTQRVGFGLTLSSATAYDAPTSDFKTELAHLKMSMPEKIEHFNKMYPKGLPIMDASTKCIGYAKWEKILPYEFWVILNHGQTFHTIARRDGMSPRELAAVCTATEVWRLKEFTEPEVLTWLQESDFFTPAK